MKWLKHNKWILIPLGIVMSIAVFLTVKNEKDWKTDFVCFSSQISYSSENYVPQPANNILYEWQKANESVETEEDIYYINVVLTSDRAERIYAYNKKSGETRLVYETRADDEDSIRKFNTNGSKLILFMNNDKVKIVDILTQFERQLSVPKYRCISVVGQDLIYNKTDGSVWRQNIRSGECEQIEGINANIFVVDEEYIYYEDNDNGGYISIYDIKSKSIKRTDTERKAGFFKGENGVEYR